MSSASRGTLVAVLVLSVALLFVILAPASASAAASAQASCTGIAVTAVATGEPPGTVAELTRMFHEEFKAAGLPPGSFDAAFSQLHAGSLEACLAAAG